MKKIIDVSTSGDFKDTEATLNKIKKTKVVIFYLTRNWFNDKRSQKEWEYACEIQKPMIYIIDAGVWLQPYHFKSNLIATINNYGNKKQNTNYLMAILDAWRKENGF